MGLLSFLFRGNSGFATATNALLAEYMLPNLTSDQKKKVRAQIAHIFRAGGFPGLTDEFIRTHFNSKPRAVQLNFIAIALNDLGINPPFKGEFWHEVRNPFLPNIYDAGDMEAVQARLSNQHRIHFQISPTPMDIMEL